MLFLTYSYNFMIAYNFPYAINHKSNSKDCQDHSKYYNNDDYMLWLVSTSILQWWEKMRMRVKINAGNKEEKIILCNSSDLNYGSFSHCWNGMWKLQMNVKSKWIGNLICFTKCTMDVLFLHFLRFEKMTNALWEFRSFQIIIWFSCTWIDTKKAILGF